MELLQCPFCCSTSFNTVDILFNIGVKCNSCFMIMTNEHVRGFNDFFKKFNNRKTQWISVKDRLPENTDNVLTSINDTWGRYEQIAYLHRNDLGNNWHDLNGIRIEKYKVTHWMPVPKLPEEK